MTNDVPGIGPETPVPPPPPQPTGAQYQHPGPPPPAAPGKRGRGCVIVAVIVAVLVIVAGVAIFLGISVFVGRQAKAESAISEVKATFRNIEDIFDELDTLWVDAETSAEGDAGAALRTFAETASPALDEALRELEDAEDAVRDLDASPAKNALTEGLDETKAAIEALQDMVGAAGKLAPFLTSIDEASELLNQASDLLNDSIDKSNEEDYEAALRDAQRAGDLYEDARAKLDEASAANPEGGVEGLIAVVEMSQERASVSVRAIEYAEQGDFSEYDDMVDRYNELNDDIEDAQLPGWIDDPSLLLGEMESAHEDFIVHVDNAREAFARAQERFDAGQY